MLSVATVTALVESILCAGSAHMSVWDGDVPALGDVLVAYGDGGGGMPSRLPLRG